MAGFLRCPFSAVGYHSRKNMTPAVRRVSSALLLAAAVLASRCGSSATTATSPTSLTRCSVTLSGTTAVPAAGGSGTIAVAAARECAWTATVEGAWLSLKSAASGQGDGSVEFSASMNPDPVTRRGAVVLNQQRVELTQAAGECTIRLAESATSFSQAGGTGRVEVVASSGMCTWTAEADATWIVLRSDANGRGTGAVQFEVLPTTGPPRSGTIKVAGQRFSITQSEGCAYSITPPAFNAGASGGSGSVTVTTIPGCPWTAGSNVPWVTLSQSEGIGPGAIGFTVAPTSGSTRSGTAVIAGQTFTVTQAPGCTYTVEPAAHSVGTSGGSVSVNVAAASGCNWTASSGASWITLSGGGTGSGPGVATFIVAPATGSARTASVTVAGKAVTISQAGVAAPTCSYSISPESVTIPGAGGTGKVAVAADAGCAWTAVSNAPWIQVSSGAAGTGAGEVAYTVEALSGVGRSGTVTIAGKTFTVTQGDACTYALSPTSQNIPAAGGSGSVAVTSGTGCTWTALSNAAWVTITSGASGSGNGTVGYSVAAESTGASRTGTLTIGGQTFTIIQAAGCSYAIAPEVQNADAPESTFNVAVTAGSGCSWSATSNVPWITLRTTGPLTGDGVVQVTVSANTGAARTGTATIAGRTLTVNQAAAPPPPPPPPCTFTVKPTDINVPADDKLVKIEVTTSSTCSWTAESQAAWISVTSGAAGTGSGDVWIAMTKNEGPDRTGTVLVAGQTVNVRQKGR